MLFAANLTASILSLLFPETEESVRILREQFKKKIAMRFEDCEWQYEEPQKQTKIFFKLLPENVSALFAFAA